MVVSTSDEISAEREAMAAAVATEPAKAVPSAVVSEAKTAAIPAEPVPIILGVEGRRKRSGTRSGNREAHATGFPPDSWNPAQARKRLKAIPVGAVPIMRREGSLLRWRITPPELCPAIRPRLSGATGSLSTAS